MQAFNRSGSSIHVQARKHQLNRKGHRTAVLVAAAIATMGTRHAYGVTGTWNAGSGVWAVPGNWVSSVVPGANNGTTVSTDTAYFNELATGPTITIDANRNIGTITFDNTNSNSGVFSLDAAGATSPLLLTSGGIIQNTASVAANQNINAPLIIEGTNGTYTFSSNAGGLNPGGDSSVGLKFTGQISGGAAGNTTLTLGGVSADTSTAATNTITGPIVDGSSTHLNLVVNMDPNGITFTTGNNGAWVLGGGSVASTYTGTTTINAGTLEVLTPNGISANTDVTINPTTVSGVAAAPQLLDEAPTSPVVVHSVTVQGSDTNGFVGGNMTVISSATATLEVTAQTNPGILIYTGTSTTSTGTALPIVSDGGSSSKNGSTFYLGGSGAAGTGGFTYINNSGVTSGPVISSNINLDVGAVTRTIFIGKSYLPNSSAPSTDLQIRNIADSVYYNNPSANGNSGPAVALGIGTENQIGFIKTGGGSLKLNDSTVTYADATLEIQQGSLKLIGGSSGGGSNTFEFGPTVPVILDGSTAELNINSTSTTVDNATFGAITATAGIISTSDTASRLFAPSFNFNIAAGSALSVQASLGDNNDPSSLAISSTFTSLAGYATPTISSVKINGAGTTTFSGVASSYTGGTTISNGATVIANANTTAINPFSTGAISMSGSTLEFAPSASAGSGTSISYAAVNGASGTQLTYTGGNVLQLKVGNETNLTLTLGDGGSVLTRGGHGSLVIQSDAADLGSTTGTFEQLLVNGSTPTLTNGIVSPAIVGQSGSNGDFLTYGASGFINTAYAADENINDASSNTTVFKDDGLGGDATLTNPSATVYAFNNGGQAISLGANTLNVGNGSGQAGIIVNGGSISGGTIAFGAAEGTIYTSSTGAAITSNFTGTGGLTTFGPGTLTLSGTNTSLSGGLNINQGVLSVSSDANLGSSSNGITLGGGTLQFNTAFNPSSSHAISLTSGGGSFDTDGNNIIIASAITDSGSGGTLNKVGSGTLTLTGANVYSGLTNISAGALQIGNNTSSGTIGTGNVTNNSALIFNLTSSPTVVGVISGSGTVTQAGTGTVALTASNSFGGQLSVSSGVLKVSNANAAGYGGIVPMDTAVPQAVVSGTGTLDLAGNVINKPITLNGGTLTNSGSTTAGLSTGVAGYTTTSNNGGPGTGSGSGISGGAAQVTVTGNDATASGATVDLVLGLAPGAMPNTVTAGAGTATLVTGGSGYTSAPTLTISGGGGTGATATAVISGGSISQVIIDNPGSGYLTAPSFGISGGGGTGASISGWAGNFTVVGTQALTPGTGYGSGALNTPSVTVDTGTGSVITPVLNSVSVAASSVITENGSGAISIPVAVTGTAASGTPVLTLSGSSAADSISGPITGTLGITKSGTSTWTFTGANSYNAATTISGGALQIGNGGANGSLGTAGVTDNASLVFNLSTSPTVANAITGTGSVTQAGSGTVTLDGANGYGNTNVNSGGLIIAQSSTPNVVALGSGAVSIASTATLQLADNASQSTPFLSSSADISNQLMQISSLSITSGGVMDIRNNHFYVADSGGADDTTYTSLLGYVKSGAVTSTEGDSGYGVGIVDGNDSVSGTHVSANQIEIAYTLDGDANLDGKVDITDFNIFAPNFGSPTTLGWEAGDFGYFGNVNITDFNLFAGNFGASDSGTAVSLPAADVAALNAFMAANNLTLPTSSVPEPASLGLLAIGATSLLARRRRKNA